MNKNAKAWVAALRSGDYKQTKAVLAEQLNGDYGYCCLGVACELYAKEHPKFKVVEIEESDTTHKRNIKKYDVDGITSLPNKVRKWLNLSDTNGTYYPEDSDSSSLAFDNDQGATFDEIADLIERNPNGLFKTEI